MHKLISWFQINYPEYREELISSMHNFDDKDLNPYHLESDCWSHTMMVCKIAELEKYDKVVQVAALLHDIGKPPVRRVNPRNNHVQFFGHETVSAYLSLEVMHKMLDEHIINKDEFVEIFMLIALHSILHKEKNIKILFEQFKDYKNLYLHLVELNKCDNLGRFSETGSYTDETEKILKSLSQDMINKKFPSKFYTLLDKTQSMNKIDFIIRSFYIS